MTGVADSSSAHHYRGEDGESYHRGKRRLPEAAFDWVTGLRAEKFQEYVDDDDVVVEFGAGAGWNLASLLCGRRIAIDVADFLADELREREIEFKSDSVDLDSSTVNVLICHHMLEHVTAPATVLLEAHRILKPSGRLLLYVPYENERRFRRYDRTDPNHHLYAWNVQTMAALVEECGFVVESAGLNRYGYDRAAASAAVRLGIGERGFRALRVGAHIAKPVREVHVIARPVSPQP